MNDRAGKPVTIPRPLRQIIGQRIVEALQEKSHRVLAVSVSGQHCHIVVELPDHIPTMREIIGDAKRLSSKAVRREMPGCIWAAGGDSDPIDDRDHLASAVNYVLTKQGPTAWTWSYRKAKP